MNTPALQLRSQNQQNNERLYRAMVAAFSAIAYADFELHEDEKKRFVEVIEASGVAGESGRREIEHDVNVLVSQMEQDFERGLAVVFGGINEVAGIPEDAEVVMEVAMMAIVADEKITPHEEKMIRKICKTLSLPTKRYCIDE